MKLSEKESKLLFELDNRINSLYEEKKQLIEQLKEKYPEGAQGVFNDSSLEKPWVRTTFINNAKAFLNGDDLYRVARFTQYEIKVETLKNEPKDKNPING